jgi:hypothetical protein
MATSSKTTTSTPSKTPYEIRLELLQMAKSHLDATFKAQCDFAAQIMDAAIKANHANIEQLQAMAPKGYGIDEITRKAGELYAFILKKD